MALKKETSGNYDQHTPISAVVVQARQELGLL